MRHLWFFVLRFAPLVFAARGDSVVIIAVVVLASGRITEFPREEEIVGNRMEQV